ncbi:hypothetical protein PLICRDRAFT_34118 [Plicaturopsis crispa FD-325 SS-3]|nr:hypothetical protein PLICRDRAFT_34118 [Plicaturopsis crispa FD-325 SS-3]
MNKTDELTAVNTEEPLPAPSNAASTDSAAKGPADVPPDGVDASPTPLSKNAQKKAAKMARYAEQKLERRAREKAVKKEKKLERAQKRAAGELDDDDEGGRKVKRAKLGKGTPFNARVVVDLGFDDMMSDKEVKSLCSQLAYTYSANRRSSSPFSKILFTSLNGRTLERLESLNDAGYKRWTSTEWWEEGYDALWTGERDTRSAADGAAKDTRESDQGMQDGANEKKDSVVYLTADCDDELTELKEGETYIIGGICDHNRYKNLCLNKAQTSGIRTARLPIGRYLATLATRKVLTVNQVFEILLRWVETRDWEKALYSVMPKRKFNEKGKRGKGIPAGTGADDEDDENEDGDGEEDGGGAGNDDTEADAAREEPAGVEDRPVAEPVSQG